MYDEPINCNNKRKEDISLLFLGFFLVWNGLVTFAT